MADVNEYEAMKHPDSDMDYGRRWGDITHEESQVLTTTTTYPDGTVTEVESIETVIILDVKGWLRSGEVIIESIWEITSDTENPPSLIESYQGEGINDEGNITSIFLRGGTAGVNYKLTNTIRAYDDTEDTYRKVSKMGVIKCGKV